MSKTGPEMHRSQQVEQLKMRLSHYISPTRNDSRITNWNDISLPQRISLSSFESFNHTLHSSNVYSRLNKCRYNSGEHDESLERIGPDHRLHSSLKSWYLSHTNYRLLIFIQKLTT